MTKELNLKLTPFETEIINRLIACAEEKYDVKSTFEGEFSTSVIFEDNVEVEISIVGADNREQYEQILTYEAICIIRDNNLNVIKTIKKVYSQQENFYTSVEFTYGENIYRVNIFPTVSGH